MDGVTLYAYGGGFMYSMHVYMQSQASLDLHLTVKENVLHM